MKTLLVLVILLPYGGQTEMVAAEFRYERLCEEVAVTMNEWYEHPLNDFFQTVYECRTED